jgi:hypothetical protein
MAAPSSELAFDFYPLRLASMSASLKTPGKWRWPGRSSGPPRVAAEGVSQGQPIRLFEDGDFVFAHTEFDFAANPRVAFDIFRFENDQIVEHWDNLAGTR